MTPMQLRLARTVLKWGVRELAEASGITANTISRIENGKDAKQSTILQLRKVLEERGVIFIEDGKTQGVSYRVDRIDDAGNERWTETRIDVPKNSIKK